jgi:HEXXH motif-containing protein
MMELRTAIDQFLRQPIPLWEGELTALLVHQRERTRDRYALPVAERWRLQIPGGDRIIWLEAPVIQPIAPFYEEHGLSPLGNVIAADGQSKLNGALKLLGQVNGLLRTVSQLVNSIQVLKSDDKEIDVSYSHPEILSTIFVSVCSDLAPLSHIRVAESILHESMHLKLTLIEQIVPLVNPDTRNRYYSPWRDEGRPARGVMHGLFVFRAIFDFFRTLNGQTRAPIKDHLDFRQEQIIDEFRQLDQFACCPDLTPDGAILIKNLLPLN